MLHKSITNIDEPDFIRQLLADPLKRLDLLDISGIPDDLFTCERVDLQEISGGKFKGDIDIFACAPSRPEEAVAIQIKRVKIKAATFQHLNPNKLAELKKAIRQSNTVEAIGFWKVYQYVFIVIDSREQNKSAPSYVGATPQLEQRIDKEMGLPGLSNRVGIVKYSFIQPMDHQPLTVGAGSIQIYRNAIPATQDAELTRRIKRLMDSRWQDFQNATTEALQATTRGSKIVV